MIKDAITDCIKNSIKDSVGPELWNFSQLQTLWWWDASDTATITESSGLVSQVDDKSGLGRHLIEPSGSNQPTTGTRSQNGLNVLDCITDDFMYSDFSTTLAQPITIFMVAKRDSATGYLLDGLGVSNRNAIVPSSGNEAMFAGSVLEGNTVTTTYQVLTAVYNGTTSKLYRDGVEIASGAAGAQNVTGIVVFAQYNGTAIEDGAFAECAGVDGAMSPEQISFISDSLVEKWGI